MKSKETDVYLYYSVSKTSVSMNAALDSPSRAKSHKVMFIFCPGRASITQGHLAEPHPEWLSCVTTLAT